MKILLICGAGIVSGKEIMSLHLLKELKRKGHNCFCIVSSWGSNDFRERLNEIEVPLYNLRIGFISKTLTWSAMRMSFIQVFFLPGLLVRYFFLKRRLKPDVVIHTNFHHTFLLYPVLGGVRNLYWSHEILSTSSFYKRLFQLFDRKIERFVSVSEAVALSLREFVSDMKVIVVRNGTTHVGSATLQNPNHSQLVLAVIGQVAKHKGHEVLLEALSQIPKNAFILQIIGSGSPFYERHLRMLITKYSLTDQILWRGFVKDPSEIYAGVDLVIVPSIFPDPFPTIVMEAGVRGIPVIASAIGGLPEMIVEGKNGFLFASGNPEALSNKITEVLNFEDFASLKKQCFDFASRNFTIERFVISFENILIENGYSD